MDVPAGWYPDPAAPSTSARWWDGAAWSRHTLPLASLPRAPQGPAYAVPSADTVVLPVAPSPDFVPPFATSARSGTYDTSVYPLGEAADYSAFPAAPEPPGRSVGWGVIALIVGLVLVILVAGVVVVRGLGSGTGGANASSPRPTTSTPSQPSSPTPTGSPSGSAPGAGGSASAVAAGKVLETFKPSAAGLGAGVTATLIPDGDVAQGQKTLDGWCSEDYVTEKDRIARRQWALTQDGQDLGLSVEAVAYATPAQAAAALAEFTARTRACHDVTLDEDGTSVTQDVVSTASMTGLPAGVTGARGTVTVTGEDTDGTPFSGISTATVQRKGQYLSIVWTNQSSAVSPGDQAVIDQFVAEQTAALAATS